MAQSNQLNPVVDTIQAKKNVISGTIEGAARTLNPWESNSLFLFDLATTCVVTLPSTCPGVCYDFAESVSATSTHKIITGSSDEYLTGSIISDDSDTSDAMAFFVGNGASHIALTMNGSTTGGLKGTRMRFTYIGSSLWMVEGVNVGSGTVATPFATS